MIRVSNRVFWASVFLAGCAILSNNGLAGGQKAASFDKITAKTVEIVDRKGVRRAVISTHDESDNLVGTVFFNMSYGGSSAKLLCRSDQSSFELESKSGQKWGRVRMGNDLYHFHQGSTISASSHQMASVSVTATNNKSDPNFIKLGGGDITAKVPSTRDSVNVELSMFDSSSKGITTIKPQ